MGGETRTVFSGTRRRNANACGRVSRPERFDFGQRNVVVPSVEPLRNKYTGRAAGPPRRRASALAGANMRCPPMRKRTRQTARRFSLCRTACFAICAFAEGLWQARSSDCREASPDVGLHGLMRAFGCGLKRRCGALVPFMAQGPLAQAQGPLYQNNGRGRRRFRRCASREAI